MRGWTVGAVATAVLAGAIVLPGTAVAAEKDDRSKPEIGVCDTKVDKIKDKSNRKSAAEKKKANPGKAVRGGNDRALTAGVFVICK
jgi:hypothetical protein